MLSVNLLPPQYKKEVELSKDNRKKLSKIFISTVILVFVLALSGGSYLYFNQIVREKTDAISKLDPQINDLGKTEKKFTSLQGRIELLKTLVNDHLYWNDLYETIYASLPTDVKFNQIILNSDLKKSQQITGISPDLERIATFRETLENNNFMSEVKIETISYSDNTNDKGYSFKINFKLSKEAFAMQKEGNR
ncbi:TPA: hypothetical protein DDW69_02730 [candidate division CPR2 bacterium]|uniref:Fimbrial assembly family protein n=1 Tax=candidate division CPR2 bacterium GW2011_GWC1_41_48 TaxID=1618344 RepID=A0A0G0YI32_UNCC2|nr:MAG: hypothetical protein UT47_C0003G0252 [candidate division CPR2 bacterium GW2011_GWC2_39_35]KKR28191.1 MAG: hypothetical protein UT59_C0033G0008 [candidate division CPR2 bacterium GW2011_GWD1_39_7]KKS09191.1 MAG: hypothetical protein UU65_C0003G0246 [candidate division CPR2 bacterium GW2011_GWC1_41_48]OGB60360.1 MAG: hypothetical protein A2Y27_03105 [candidate division CPR2 bacterium GWD1_39_7]HBG81736.1 hypothetical protein [candidate division CPR2 bacterium]